MIKESKVLFEPTNEPVDLQQAKDQLYITSTDRDLIISRLIKVARRICEKDSGLSFMTQTRVMKLDSFPCDDSPIEIPFGPIQAISGTDSASNTLGVSYIDSNGATQTLALTTDFILDSHNSIPRIAPVDTWPDTDDVINAVTITYKAGYSSAANVPDEIKHAIICQVAAMHEHPEGDFSISESAMSLLDTVRVYMNARQD